MSTLNADALESTRQHIEAVYGEVPELLLDGIAQLFENARLNKRGDSLWDENDVVLITYADQVRPKSDDTDVSPLEAQRQFLVDHDLNSLLRCVHLLPFCPSTSDDGFSVADYLAVDPDSGTWDDIARMGVDFDLMYDLVLNHCSASHPWFRGFLDGDARYEDFIACGDPDAGSFRRRSSA